MKVAHAWPPARRLSGAVVTTSGSHAKESLTIVPHKCPHVLLGHPVEPVDKVEGRFRPLTMGKVRAEDQALDADFVSDFTYIVFDKGRDEYVSFEDRAGPLR